MRSGSESHPEIDNSDCNLSDRELISTMGVLLPTNWTLLNGIQNEAVVPAPRAESSVMSPRIKSTNYQDLVLHNLQSLGQEEQQRMNTTKRRVCAYILRDSEAESGSSKSSCST